MLKKIRKNKKGFTLAELLIVVAIIGVLVAVSIPIFTKQLSKARVATNEANARAAYAAAISTYLADDSVVSGVYYVNTGTFDSSAERGSIADTADYGSTILDQFYCVFDTEEDSEATVDIYPQDSGNNGFNDEYAEETPAL